MSFVMASHNKLWLGTTEITKSLNQIDIFLDPETGWNLVASGLFRLGSTMEWARDLPKDDFTRVQFRYQPTNDSDRYDGWGKLKNFKITSKVEDLTVFKLHLKDVVWTGNWRS